MNKLAETKILPTEIQVQREKIPFHAFYYENFMNIFVLMYQQLKFSVANVSKRELN